MATLTSKLAAACVSGIGKVQDRIQLKQLAAQTLCNSNAPITFESLLLTQFVSTVATSYVTGSFTVQPNKLLLAVIGYEKTQTISGVTGLGLTWVLVNTGTSAIGGGRCSIYRSMAAASASGALTVATGFNSSSGATIAIQQWSNVNTSGTNGSGAIVQSGNATGTSVTLAALNPNFRNAIVGTTSTNNGASQGTVEGGWTLAYRVTQNPGVARCDFCSYQLRSIDNTYNSAFVNLSASVAAEIKWIGS